MNRFIILNSLNQTQREQYTEAISDAFPPIISKSKIIKKYWSKLETYFPEYQQLLIAEDDELIGFINALPFHFEGPLADLPETGWDWMFEKGISDFEQNIKPNYLGALQVIVRNKFKGRGYSKHILHQAKQLVQSTDLTNLVIPIRPTKKHQFPKMPMTMYLQLKDNDRIFDPWIRTHIAGGADIIKVCEKSMTVVGDITFWESILDRKISESGTYQLEGALNLISIDLTQNFGQYIEPNIWIKYD